MSYAVKKTGVPFRVKLKTNASCTGEADNFTGFYVDDLTETKVDITGTYTELADAPGVFLSPEINIANVDDYTFIFNNANINMVNHAAPVVVKAANLDDVQNAITAVQTDVTQVLSDIADLNGGGSSLGDLATEVAKIKELIESSKVQTFTLAGDRTADIAVDDTFTGATSGATGTVTNDAYDADSDTTIVSVKDAVGTFVDGENVNGGAVTDSPINGVTNVTDSVKEFVEAINAAMSGENGISDLIKTIASYTDNIENMITGTEFLADGVTENPLYGKSILSIYNKIEEANDADITDSLANRIATVKSVVDVNGSLLADADNGLVATKAAIDTLANGKTLGDVIDTIFNDETNGIAALKTYLAGRFDNVDTAIANLDDKVSQGSSYEVFA